MIGFAVGTAFGMFITLLTLFILTSFDHKLKEPAAHVHHNQPT